MGDGGLPRIAMAPLSKDTVAVANPSGESTVSKASIPAKSASGHLRADAVSLDVPVKVHGSRVTEVVAESRGHRTVRRRNGDHDRVPPRWCSQTLDFRQPGANARSHQPEITAGRDLPRRESSNVFQDGGYVEVEFTHPQPGSRGVYFPSDGPASQNKPGTSALAASLLDQTPPAAVKEKLAQDVSWFPGAAPIKQPNRHRISRMQAPRQKTRSPQLRRMRGSFRPQSTRVLSSPSARRKMCRWPHQQR